MIIRNFFTSLKFNFSIKIKHAKHKHYNNEYYLHGKKNE